MTTASNLIFQGDLDGNFVVRDAETGTKLHTISVGSSMVAAPMTYSVDQQQYVAIMANGDNVGRIVVFRLGGGAVPKPTSILKEPPVEDRGTAEQIAIGREQFEQNCVFCHGTSGRAPNLSKMTEKAHQDFIGIVLRGERSAKGMPNFGSSLSEPQAHAIHDYLIHQAWQNYLQTRAASLR